MDNGLIFPYRFEERCGEGVVKVPRTDERAFKGVGIDSPGKSGEFAETRKDKSGLFLICPFFYLAKELRCSPFILLEKLDCVPSC